MPIFEYTCRSCNLEFEAIVKRGDEPPCPTCGEADVERRHSVFARPFRAAASLPEPCQQGACDACPTGAQPGTCGLH